jgi:hypothetical protein
MILFREMVHQKKSATPVSCARIQGRISHNILFNYIHAKAIFPFDQTNLKLFTYNKDSIN